MSKFVINSRVFQVDQVEVIRNAAVEWTNSVLLNSV